MSYKNRLHTSIELPSGNASAYMDGWWKLDDGSGIILADSSGLGRNLQLAPAGGPSLDGASVSGDFWNSGFARWSTANEHEVFYSPSGAIAQPNLANRQFMLFALSVRCPTAPAANAICFSWRAAAATAGFLVWITATRIFQVSVHNGTTSAISAGGTDIGANTWARIVGAFDFVNNLVWLKKDGAAYGTADATALGSGTNIGTTPFRVSGRGTVSPLQESDPLHETDMDDLQLYFFPSKPSNLKQLMSYLATSGRAIPNEWDL